MSRNRFAGVAGILVFLLSGIPALAAGHYTLAWWRQKGAWENASAQGCMGSHVMNVWVFDEAGDPKPGVNLKTTWNVLIGTTDIDGRAEIPIDVNNTRYDMVCDDGTGATSDVALEMSSRLKPCWGHYSYELGFLYKSNAQNPGAFDTGLNCTLNYGCADYGSCSDTTDAPFTKSLAYNALDCVDYWSDSSTGLGSWQAASSYFGQTFVANGNRVVAARAHGVIGGNDLLSFNAQIVTWPGMQPVGPVSATPVRWPFGWIAFWGIDDVQVTPGQTYMLKVWRDGSGMNAYRIDRNVYPNGQYYEGATAFAGRELIGFVCCANANAIHITAGPSAVNLKSIRATIQWTTDAPGDSTVDYGLTTSYGSQVSDPTLVTNHSITLTGLVPYTTYHFKVTSKAEGYCDAVSDDSVFMTTVGVSDLDDDDDVDQEDFGVFQACLTGPGTIQSDPACLRARLDTDVDVDQDDFAVFLACVTGPGLPADPGCTE